VTKAGIAPLFQGSAEPRPTKSRGAVCRGFASRLVSGISRRDVTVLPTCRFEAPSEHGTERIRYPGKA